MKLDYNYVWMVYHIIFYFLHQLVYLVYSGIIVSFYQGGTGVPCTPFCVSAAPLCCHLPALLLVGGDRGMVYSGEMRCLGEWVVCGSPGVPTWRVWTLRHPPTGSAAHWSSALAPGILVCSSGWRCWTGLFGGNEVSKEVGFLWYPWHAYLKRLSPAPSSHWGLCTLIRCAGTRNPRMQERVARTKVIAILLLTYLHVLE